MTKQRKAPEALTFRYKEWIRRMRKGHLIDIAFYSCPTCDKVIGTRAAPFGEVWDSFAVCPFCGDLHFKLVDGHTVTSASTRG